MCTRNGAHVTSLATIDNLFCLTKERTVYDILHESMPRKILRWSWLTDQNFGQLKTDNTIFYATISLANNICIERKIFCIVTFRSFPYPPASPFRFSASAVSRQSRFFIWNIFNVVFFEFLRNAKFVCIQRNCFAKVALLFFLPVNYRIVSAFKRFEPQF